MSESSFPADFKRKIENCYLSHGKHSCNGLKDSNG